MYVKILLFQIIEDLYAFFERQTQEALYLVSKGLCDSLQYHKQSNGLLRVQQLYVNPYTSPSVYIYIYVQFCAICRTYMAITTMVIGLVVRVQFNIKLLSLLRAIVDWLVCTKECALSCSPLDSFVFQWRSWRLFLASRGELASLHKYKIHFVLTTTL